MRTFDDVFEAFGGPAALAKEIGIEPFHAQTMKTRGSIPPGYWLEVIGAASRLASRSDTPLERRSKLLQVTDETLVAIAAKKAGRESEPVQEAS